MPAPTWRDDQWLRDPKLKDYATTRQAQFIDAVLAHETIRGAAKAVGVVPSVISESLGRLRKAAALRGYSPAHDMHHTVPDGFKVKGVSTYYDKEGQPRGQWVKSAEDRARIEELLKAFVLHLTEEARGLCPPAEAPTAESADLLSCYLFGDPHFGMKASRDDGADDFDNAAADRLTRAGIDRLAAAMPASEEALLVLIGDNTHANDGSHRTPGHGNPLDMDAGGHSQSLLISAKAWAYACRRLLTKHLSVRVWVLPGNHDPNAAFALALCLSMYFDSEPRITIDLSRSLYRCMRFGKVLIGAHHGHGAKQADLPLLMAVDNPADWGASVVRYIYQGHIHHDAVKEIQGVRVEAIRTLAGKDAWHAGQGYRSMRDTRGIVHHKDFGEIERHTVSAAMLA